MSSSAQRNRRREQRESTRREILEAADRFLREHPYRELSLEAVMAPTGLTRTAFYRHFDDLSELVLQLLADVGEELYGVAERWREEIGGGDFATAAHDALAAIVDFFTRHGPLVRAIADAAGTDEGIEAGYRGFLEAFIELTAGGLEQLAEQGRVVRRDYRQLTRALNLMNERYLLDVFGRPPPADPVSALSTLENVWLGAIGAVGPEEA